MTYQYVKAQWPGTGDDPDQIKRIADNAHNPKDEMNMDWVEYKKWLDDGNTPQASD